MRPFHLTVLAAALALVGIVLNVEAGHTAWVVVWCVTLVVSVVGSIMTYKEDQA